MTNVDRDAVPLPSTVNGGLNTKFSVDTDAAFRLDTVDCAVFKSLNTMRDVTSRLADANVSVTLSMVTPT